MALRPSANSETSTPSATTEVCAILAIDPADLLYRACSICERSLPDDPSSLCKHCDRNSFNPGPSGSKRLFRLLMSIATDKKVFTVICFDRVARIMFGTSADEFFDFSKLHPFAAVAAARMLEGELFRMTLSKPRSGNAQHLRVTSLVPMRSGYQPVIEGLRELYRVRAA
ncbi:uncharacterized protein LOC115734166 [Rhodamnia argentea]|uniref:Uncharacterized protein LOC115734166 n=1 Tax=Rhodamnia argentea TaxID=178133 RepID=A0A8B8NEI0_9MYRT|nr:uncharacterized protein LOC115734166 [Rhodamnia argentea]